MEDIMKRGEIYYIESRFNEVGSEQRAGRPAIIVSNDKCNASSPTVEVVYLTTQTKNDLPTHVDIRCTQRNSIALCEQINSVSVDRIGDYLCTCSDYEMELIDAALAISLGLTFDTHKEAKTAPAPAPTPVPSLITESANIVKLSVERDLYKLLYEELLNKLIGGTENA
jgi:mRNA interferase MazF